MTKHLRPPAAAKLFNWRNFDAKEWWRDAKDFLPQLKPQPNTGRLWLDMFFLLVVATFQFTVLPDLTSGFVYVDMMTVWLAINFVQQSYGRSTFLCLVGALIWETHTSAPMGIYICAYWIILNIIYQVRETLSWRQPMPWMATFVMSEVALIAFEIFVATITRGVPPLETDFLLVQIARVGLTVLFGMTLSRYWLHLFVDQAADQEMLKS